MFQIGTAKTDIHFGDSLIFIYIYIYFFFSDMPVFVMFFHKCAGYIIIYFFIVVTVTIIITIILLLRTIKANPTSEVIISIEKLFLCTFYSVQVVGAH